MPLKQEIVRAHILKALNACTGSNGFDPGKVTLFINTVCVQHQSTDANLYQEVGTYPIATWYPAGGHPDDSDLARLWKEIFQRLGIAEPADRSCLKGTMRVSEVHNLCVAPHVKGKEVSPCG